MLKKLDAATSKPLLKEATREHEILGGNKTFATHSISHVSPSVTTLSFTSFSPFSMLTLQNLPQNKQNTKTLYICLMLCSKSLSTLGTGAKTIHIKHRTLRFFQTIRVKLKTCFYHALLELMFNQKQPLHLHKIGVKLRTHHLTRSHLWVTPGMLL